MHYELSGRGWPDDVELRAALIGARALWRLATSELAHQVADGKVPAGASTVVVRSLAEEYHLPDPDAPATIARLVDRSLVEKTVAGNVQRPLEFILDAVKGRNAADVKYLVLRELRAEAELKFSAESVYLIRKLCEAVNNSLGPEPVGTTHYSEGPNALLSQLEAALPSAVRETKRAADLPRRFIELCWMLDYVRPTALYDTLHFRRTVSHDRVLSHLFGLPTAIPGFDALFSDGGVFIADAPQTSPEPMQETGEDEVGARTILVSGPFGSGKSLLSLEFAVEVARKGGVAWILGFEQTTAESLYSLETIGINTRDERFRVVSGLIEALECFADKTPGGVIAIFSPGELGYVQFLDSLEQHLDKLKRFPLRVVIIDPLNSLLVDQEQSPYELRARAVKFLQAAKKCRVNLLACERAGEQERWEGFEEKIADTVLHLGVELHGHYRRRFIEVTKSRLQREQAGRHSIFIRNTGLRIFPSSIAISTPTAERRTRPDPEDVSLGVQGLDEILDNTPVQRGDVVIYTGPAGTGKTIAGIRFLVAHSTKERSSIFVADRDPRKLDALVQAARNGVASFGRRVLEHCPIHPGFADPGLILERIQQKLVACRDAGRPADRVMVSNLSRWVASIPLVRTDQTFGVALLAMMWRFNATLLIAFSESDDPDEKALRSFMAEHADCVVEFYPISVRGVGRSVLRVVKTRHMTHRREAFEVSYDSHHVTVEPTTSLLRLHPDGNTSPVPIALYLHSETRKHWQYNRKLLGVVRAVLSPHASIRRQYDAFDPHMLRMGASSAVDEVQVLQLDEFQIPGATAGRSLNLASFPREQVKDLVEGRVRRLQMRDGMSPQKALQLVPFYDNISLLAYRKSAFRRSGLPGSWQELAAECVEWERDNDGLFFACHVCGTTTMESYNCLFLEILRSIQEPPEYATSSCHLLEWMEGSAGQQAAMLFWQLCRRSHLATVCHRRSTPDSSVYAGAKVWRHWYNTLNQMLHDMPPDDVRDIEVVPLYNNMTTAGEWYLGVTAHSAAPEVALQLIRYLTTREQELRRVHLGVGLPTRENFYDMPAPDSPVRLSPFFSLDGRAARELIDRAFRRSRFACYESFSEVLSSHLLRILRLPEEGIVSAIEATVASVRSDFAFVQSVTACDVCRTGLVADTRNGIHQH